MPFWNPFRLWQDTLHEIRTAHATERQAFLTILHEMTDTAKLQAQASSEQARLLQQYFRLFEPAPGTPTPPEVVDREVLELKADLQRQGFPVDADPETQLRWAMDYASFPPL